MSYKTIQMRSNLILKSRSDVNISDNRLNECMLRIYQTRQNIFCKISLDFSDKKGFHHISDLKAKATSDSSARNGMYVVNNNILTYLISYNRLYWAFKRRKNKKYLFCFSSNFLLEKILFSTKNELLLTIKE